MNITDSQRKELCNLLHQVLLDIRLLARNKHHQQAHDLADAFHNLPIGMWSDRFNLVFLRDRYLLPYHQRYQKQPIILVDTNYLTHLDSIIASAVNATQ
jgi:hypothetical protein